MFSVIKGLNCGRPQARRLVVAHALLALALVLQSFGASGLPLHSVAQAAAIQSPPGAEQGVSAARPASTADADWPPTATGGGPASSSSAASEQSNGVGSSSPSSGQVTTASADAGKWVLTSVRVTTEKCAGFGERPQCESAEKTFLNPGGSLSPSAHVQFTPPYTTRVGLLNLDLALDASFSKTALENKEVLRANFDLEATSRVVWLEGSAFEFASVGATFCYLDGLGQTGDCYDKRESLIPVDQTFFATSYLSSTTHDVGDYFSGAKDPISPTVFDLGVRGRAFLVMFGAAREVVAPLNIIINISARYELQPLPIDLSASRIELRNNQVCDYGSGVQENCLPAGQGRENSFKLVVEALDTAGKWIQYPDSVGSLSIEKTRTCGAVTFPPQRLTINPWNPGGEDQLPWGEIAIPWNETGPGTYVYRAIVNGQPLPRTATLRWYGEPDPVLSSVAVSTNNVWADGSDSTGVTVTTRDACGGVPYYPQYTGLFVNLYVSAEGQAIRRIDAGNTNAHGVGGPFPVTFSQSGVYAIDAKVYGYYVLDRKLVAAYPRGQLFAAGQVTDQWGRRKAGVAVSAVPFSGVAAASATTDASGFYLVPLEGPGTYTLVPSGTGSGFTPSTRSVTISGDGAKGQDFVAGGASPPSYVAEGRVTNENGFAIPGVVVADGAGHWGTSDELGSYWVLLPAGTHELIATKTGLAFTPSSIRLTVPPNMSNLNFTGVTETLPSLVASPNTRPADSATASTVTLSNAPPGHRVQLTSSRGAVDAFTPIAGVVAAGGTFTSAVRSSTAGDAIISAKDADADRYFSVAAAVTFTTTERYGCPTSPAGNEGGDCERTESPTNKPRIVKVKSYYDLNGAYFPLVHANNPIEVTVDWSGLWPDSVTFQLNDRVASVSTDAAGRVPAYTIDMGWDLNLGTNVIQIVANAKTNTGTSVSSYPRVFRPRGIPIPLWITSLGGELIMAGSYSGGKEYYGFGFHFPRGDPLTVASAWLPGAPTRFEWGVDGEVRVPANCFTPAEGRLLSSGSFRWGAENPTKSGPSKITVEGRGMFKTDQQGCTYLNPEMALAVRIQGSTRMLEKPVLEGLALMNPAIGEAVVLVLDLFRLRSVLDTFGKLYVDGRIRVEPKVKIKYCYQDPAEPCEIHFEDLQATGGIGAETGYEMRLRSLELKAWGAAYGFIRMVNPGPLSGYSLDFDSITLKGQIGAKWRLGWFANEHRKDWEWYYPPRALTILSSAELADLGTLHLIPHAGDENYAKFQGANPAVQALGRNPFGRLVTGAAASSTVTATLVSNVYTYTEPSLAINPMDGQAMLTWVHDNPAKPVGQSQEISFSRWDGSAWTTPAGVTDDAQLDGRPQVAWGNDGKAVAVWQRLNDTLPITATWDVTTAKKIQIATATYDAGGGNWSPVTSLTTNSALHGGPALARNGDGKLLAVWQENDAGQLVGDSTNPDRLMAAFYDAGWGMPGPAVNSTPGVVESAAGYGAGEATVALTEYITPTGAITPALQVLTVRWDGTAWSAPVQRTDDALSNQKPQVAYNSSNQPLLVWLAGSTLRLRNLTTGATSDLRLAADLGNVVEFQVVQDGSGNIAAIMTAGASQPDLYVAFYDQTQALWGSPSKLTDDRASEAYPTAGMDSTGRLLMAYSATAVTPVTQTSTLNGEPITYTVPTEGQTDLVTLSHVFTRNLTIGDGDVSSSVPTALDRSAVISATVHNSGDLAASNVKVRFYDGDPQGTGVGFSTAVTTVLPAGESAVLTATYAFPSLGGPHSVYAVVDPLGEVTESDETDNSGRVLITPDLSLSSAEVDYVTSTEVGLQALVRNVSPLSSLTTTLAIYRDGLTGTLAITASVPSITAGQSFTVTAPWHPGVLAAGSHPLVAVVNENGFSETIATNNVVSLSLGVKPDLLIDPFEVRVVTGTVSPSVRTVVYNAGLAAATNITVGIYLSPTLTTSSLVLSSTIASLAPGGSAQVGGAFTMGNICTVYVAADPGQTVDEITRDNNIVAANVCGSSVATPYHVFLPVALRAYQGGW